MICGANGNDAIYGRDGNDALYGNTGNYTLIGGNGNDVLVGGAGNDTFFFNAALNAATNVDTIIDFSVADDRIVLENGDFTALKKLLDIGVQTLLIPFIETPEEAESAVRATRYPPEGIRGVAGSTRASRYGMVPDYLKRANAQICVLVQIETAQAMARLEQIASVNDVDGVFIGPSDLAASMGHLGNPAHPEVQAAIRSAAERISAAGKVPGILATRAEDALRYRDWGYRFIAAGVDASLLMGSARTLLQTVAEPPR